MVTLEKTNTFDRKISHMNLSHVILLEGEKHIVSITPKFFYSPYLTIQFECLTSELLRTSSELSGTIDILYTLPHGEETRRIKFGKHNFNTGKPDECSASFHVNTGDLVKRIRVFLTYKLAEDMLIDIKLISNKQPLNVKMSYLDLNEPLDYLEFVRSKSGENFKALLAGELRALEATSDKVSVRTFKKWALTDKIIRLTAEGDLPLYYLDTYALDWADAYDEVKKALGHEEIVV